jgi:lipopolysaccharide export system protein LptA
MSFIFTNNEEMPIITNLFASQNVMISNEDMTASGNNASYSVRKNEILLEGNVVVKNKFTTMRGEKLFIDLETGKINFLSDDKQNNRIRGQLLENDKNQK